MELTSNEVVVSIVPNSNNSATGQSNAFDDLANQAQGYLSITDSNSIDTTILNQQRQRRIHIKSSTEVHIEDATRGSITWEFDKVDNWRSIDSDDRENLVDYALNGYDVAALSLSVGDEKTTGDQRKQDLHMILNLLQGKIDNLNNKIAIKYAYVGVNDQDCYDIRKDKHRSNQSMFIRGMDSIMRPAYDVHDIWVKMEQESTKIPYILTIKLTDQVNMTEGRLVLFDMLHPTFSVVDPPKQSDNAHYSFINLCDKIHAMTSPIGNRFLETNSYILTHEMAKFIAGHNKMTVFAYLNEHMGDAWELREAKSCLNLISQIRNIPIRMIQNNPIVKDEEINYMEFSEELEMQCERLKAENDKSKASNKILERHIAMQEKATREWANTLKQIHAYARAKEIETEYLKAKNDAGACITELEGRKLQAEKGYLIGALYIKRSLDKNLLQVIESLFFNKKDNRNQKGVCFDFPSR